MAFNISVTGLPELEAKLSALARRMPELVANALRAEAEIEMTEAKRRTPVLTGALRASGLVVGPEQSAGEVRVRLQFGGPSIGYAVSVHENLSASHPRGGQAKFLESVLRESVPHLAQRIATRMKSMLGG